MIWFNILENIMGGLNILSCENSKEKDSCMASGESLNIALDRGFTPVERELHSIKYPCVLSS